MDISRKLQEEFHLRAQQVDNVIALIDDGNTIPFIARYRKEMTGSLDDQVLRELSERLAYLRGLEKRAQEILASIEAQGQLTEALENAVHAAQTLAELEDLYRPYRPKRRTRASMARERGLEPLAAAILEQREGWDPLSQAAAYVTGPDTEAERAVPTPEDALQGAQDILAEDISDRAGLRKKLRAFVWRTGQLTAKAVDPKTESVYSNYYDFREPVNRIAGHRVLAIDRGEREELLKVTVEIRPEEAKDIVAAELVRGRSAAASLVRAACEDSFDRLIFPSLEREISTLR